MGGIPFERGDVLSDESSRSKEVVENLALNVTD